MGNALGPGPVSVVFFGTMSDRLTPPEVGPAFVDAFQHALIWVAVVMAAIFLLMSALPRRPAQHVEGAEAAPTTTPPARDPEPAPVG